MNNCVNKKNNYLISEIWGFMVLIIIFSLGYITRYNMRDNLPAPKNDADGFNAQRAWKQLKLFSNLGPRPTGTYANEVLAVQFLKKEIRKIQQESHKNQEVELDIQVVSGSFWRDFQPHGMTSIYRNVQNIVVKLHGDATKSSNSSLLLNCHFDSVPGSPGASDDALHCMSMLEILRVLSRKPNRNKNAIIFLFNGAEETGLQASHGFITKHKWSKSIKAFLNLESAGSAGKEVLFQSSSNNSWLVKLYGRTVPYPIAQAAAEEVFQSGVIPSDTDFRIFTEFGKIPGLDFAHFINGYRYHTKFDHVDYLSKEVLYHSGENIFQLTKTIANGNEITEHFKIDSGSQVFFDILGKFFISYSKDFGVIFNYSVIICAIVIPYVILSQATKGINKRHLRNGILFGCLINILTVIVSVALTLIIAFDLDLAGKSMSWYTNTIICVPLYCLVPIFVQCVLHLSYFQYTNSNLNVIQQIQAGLLGTSIFWCLLAGILTAAGIRTSYAIIGLILINLISTTIIGLLSNENTIYSPVYVHLIGQIFVVLWTSNFYNMVVDMFIPIAGRMGASKNPDILIGIICCSLTFFTTSYLTPLVILLKRCKYLLIGIFAAFAITRYYFVTFTDYGFPYQDESFGAPTIQRHFITHTIRTLYDKDGNIRYTDSGYFMLEIDRNAHKTIESLAMPEEPIPINKNILCNTELFCGLPLFSSRQLMMGGFWLPGPAPIIREIGNLSLVAHERITNTMRRLSFSLTGSYLLSLHIHLKDSVKLKNWTFLSKIPTETIYNNQKGYFVMITHGLESDAFNFTMDLKTTADHKRSLVDITLVTNHFEYHKEHTTAFANILKKFPRWTFVIPSVASVTSWTF